MLLAMLVVTAIAYVVAAVIAVRRGRAHTPLSTVAFLAGLAVLALSMRETWGPYDDGTPWVHDAQHALIMGVAPALLALGAPVRLSLQVLPTRWARRVVAALQVPPLRTLCGPTAAMHAPVDYYAVMAAYLFTPWALLADDSGVVHVATHAVFLLCGLLFWVPVVGADVGGWRPDRRTSLRLVALGIPIYAGFALATSSLSLLVVNEAATVFGLALVALHRRGTRVTVPRQRAPGPLAALTPASAAPP